MPASISVEMLAIFKNIFSVLFSIVEKMLCNKKCVQNKKAVNVKLNQCSKTIQQLLNCLSHPHPPENKKL